MIKAFIFDLDGTLYPKTNALYREMSSLIRQWFQNQLYIRDEDMERYYERLNRTHPSPLGAIHALGLSLVSFHREVFGRLAPERHLVEDTLLQEVFSRLSGEKFIVTLSSRQHALKVLDTLRVSQYFSDIVVQGVNWRTRSKLDAYEAIRKSNKWLPSEMCVVGDDPAVDLKEAYTVGYRCVAVSYDRQPSGIGSIDTILKLPSVIMDELIVSESLNNPQQEKERIDVNEQQIGNLHALFGRTTEEILSLNEWNELLRSDRQLRIKYGVDVTAPYLHIGHAVNLWMMRKLQDFGHKVIFLIGDFTTQIGDPTGRSKTRPVIPLEEIERNIAEFIEQAKMVLRFDDPGLLEIRRNSEWYGRMVLSEFLKLVSLVTHSRLISRDMFQKRLTENADIYMHELVYPVLQGYDSFMLNSDLTIIGSDQLFNEMMGRFYQERFGQRPQVIITTKITPGIDGVAKQSKSLDNYIGLGHSPRDKFGRIMRVPDNLITLYFGVYTEVSESELQTFSAMVQANPLEAKKRLATEIVRRYHGEQTAQQERDWFDRTFSQREAPQDAPELVLKPVAVSALEIVKRFFADKKSNSEIRRLFQQGGITLNGEKITNSTESIVPTDGDTFQVGKRVWFKVRIRRDS